MPLASVPGAGFILLVTGFIYKNSQILECLGETEPLLNSANLKTVTSRERRSVMQVAPPTQVLRSRADQNQVLSPH